MKDVDLSYDGQTGFKIQRKQYDDYFVNLYQDYPGLVR